MSEPSTEYSSCPILIVDDQEINVLLLESLLQDNGYTNIHSTTDSRLAEAMAIEYEPSLVLLDLMMPHLDGFDVLAQLRKLRRQPDFLPVLVLTADMSPASCDLALQGGATDFVTKPFNPTEVLLRIHNLLELFCLHQELYKDNFNLEARVFERTRQLEASHALLEQSQLEVIERLAQAAEYRDDDTGQHTQRVGLGSVLLARQLGFSDEAVELLRRAAPLHDVGKIGIPDTVLLKPGKLTEEEFAIMRTHVHIGGQILKGGQSALVQMAQLVARNHHERWDGCGYPAGLSGEEIPIEGRIVAIVDVFDALTHERPYKKAWSVAEAVEEIQKQSGLQFDPQVVEAFMLNYARFDI